MKQINKLYVKLGKLAYEAYCLEEWFKENSKSLDNVEHYELSKHGLHERAKEIIEKIREIQ